LKSDHFSKKPRSRSLAPASTIVSALLLAFAASAWTAAAADDSRRAALWPLTIISGLEPENRAEMDVLRLLANLLSVELDREVRVESASGARGVMAASRLAISPADGLTLGALSSEAMVTREIQTRTPYVLSEFRPVAAGWARLNAIVTRFDAPFDRLDQLAERARHVPTILEHDGLSPMGVRTLQALTLASDLGFSFQQVRNRRPAPQDLIRTGHVGEKPLVDALVWPLSALYTSPRLDEEKALPLERRLARRNWKIVAVMADRQDPGVPANLSVEEQGIEVRVSDWVGFYLPAEVPDSLADEIGEALRGVLRGPEMTGALAGAALTPLGAADVEELLASDVRVQTPLLSRFAAEGE
jgi:tripartite-type tricarboxylate transporter receptor subunit TctC